MAICEYTTLDHSNMHTSKHIEYYVMNIVLYYILSINDLTYSKGFEALREIPHQYHSFVICCSYHLLVDVPTTFLN